MSLKTYLIIALAAVIILPTVWFTSPPFSFPTDSMISIPEGIGLSTLEKQLYSEHIIRSQFWFRTASIILGGERNMQAGEYQFSHPQNVLIIAWRILHGDHGIEQVKITIPEGFNVTKISNLFGAKFTFFDHKAFINSAPEGFLFPDTYFVPVTATATSTIKLLNDNFNRQTLSLIGAVKLSGHTFEDIVTMASILEAEVRGEEDRKIVAGILWKRLSSKMPLQVDSAPETYKNLGLPKKPLNNPGIVSIKAALNPTTTPYLYFLTDASGTPHYSKTFEEHVAAKQKYLKK